LAQRAYLNRIGTAVPGYDVHGEFICWAEARIAEPKQRTLFRRMAARSGIEARWSVLTGEKATGPGGFYADATLPSTAARMAIYAEAAPALAEQAVMALGPLPAISHLVVASCTGFVAPGVDQLLAARLGLGGSVERTLIGFMGCYAAVAALRVARHIVLGEPGAKVLVVTVELSTLHLRDAVEIEPLLAMLLFGDGAAAALVSGEAEGFAIERPFSATLPDSADLIRWTIGDEGFAMTLSGEVPGRIAAGLADPVLRQQVTGGRNPAGIAAWAVHAGGRSVLDAVEHGLGLPSEALDPSRRVLARYGNMSSSTLMFVLAELAADDITGDGIAIAFGPGLAAEGFGFSRR
jgi:predicted naringenin-chalcone synthase